VTDGRRRQILRRRRTLPILNSQGQGHVAFWVDGIACSPLTLSATITGQKASAPKLESIPFACGE
jgi:hypothetical protein